MGRRGLFAIVSVATIVSLLTPLQAGADVTIVQLTDDADLDAETSIAVNPTKPQNLVAGWIDGRGESDQTCGYGVSFDGGLTWPIIDVVPGVQKDHGGTFDLGTDPSVAFDKDGNAYFTCLGFHLFPPGTGSAGTILVSKSTDGGQTWGDPVVAMTGEDGGRGNSVDQFQDHQFLTANPVNGTLYVTQTEFTAFGKPEILFTRSTDGGQSWSAPVRINTFDRNASFQDSFSAVGVDPDTIYVTFGAFSNGGLTNWNRIYIAKSTDGGQTFSRPQLLARITPLPDPLPNAPWRSDNDLWVAVDRIAGQIYINFADYDAGDADIRVMRVDDVGGGFEVEGITRVNDDPPGSDQFFPFITIAPGGRVDVCFQDRRYEPGNALMFTTCAVSDDRALSFTNHQVTTVPFDASNNNFIGDYNWQFSTATGVAPIFVGDGVPGGDSSATEVFIAQFSP
jgi:hypothetical protein